MRVCIKKERNKKVGGACSIMVKGREVTLHALKDYPPFTDEAVLWAKDLKKRGFKFLGPTVIYAHMQAVGMVNDHTVICFRYRELGKVLKK